MGRKEVAVFGWYGNGNAGDESFKDCFRLLWPSINLTFCDKIPADVNERFDAIWIGGGSFLDVPIPNLSRVSIPMGFIGVGGGPAHPVNHDALQRAKIVIARDDEPLPCKVEVAPDLGFCLPRRAVAHSRKGVAVLLNAFVVPNPDSAKWVHVAHEWFRWEMFSALKGLNEPIHFYPMQSGQWIDDGTAAALIGAGVPNAFSHKAMTYEDITMAISKSRVVVTQRLHGIVYSMLTDTPCVVVSHHDKISRLCSQVGLDPINYYGFFKNDFNLALASAGCVRGSAEYINGARRIWAELSGIVERTFFS